MARLFGIGRGPRRFEFRCECCGNIHRGSPSFSLRLPEHVFDVPEDERDERVVATDDLCVIYPRAENPDDEPTYWIRTVLDVPIHGADKPFCWGLWVSQSKASFEHYRDTFGEDQSAHESFGWLHVHMKHYRNADDSWPVLECRVKWGSAGQRPTVELWECDNQLYLDQRDGISWEKAMEIAMPLMHG